jgi:hypothetical protein
MADARSMATTTTEREIRTYVFGEAPLQLPAPDMLVPPSGRSRLGRDDRQLQLVVCSRCLRVLRDEQWFRAEIVIRDLRTFARDAPPRFTAVLCPLCTFSIHLRRGRGAGQRRSARWNSGT